MQRHLLQDVKDGVPMRPGTRVRVWYEFADWKGSESKILSVQVEEQEHGTEIGRFNERWLWRRGLGFVGVPDLVPQTVKTDVEALAFNILRYSDTGCANQGVTDFQKVRTHPYWGLLLQQIESLFLVAQVLLD